MATVVHQPTKQEAGGWIPASLRRVLILRERKAEIFKELKGVSKQLDELEQAVIERMALDGIQSLKIDGHLCFRSVERHCQFRDEIKDDPAKMDRAFRTLAGFGASGIIKRSIHPLTLRAWVNEQAQANDGQVPQKIARLLTIFEQYRLNVRKA